MAYAGALALVVQMLVAPNQDTTELANATAVDVAALAGLAFAYASVLDPTEADRDRVLFAGERFCHGAIILLIAAVLKYSALHLANKEPFGPILSTATAGALAAMDLVLFTHAIMNSCYGLANLNRVLSLRYARRPDWMDVV